jgi:hypothetical protein
MSTSELAFNRAILEKNNQILAILSLGSLALNLILGLALLFVVNRPPLIVSRGAAGVVALDQSQLKIDEDGLVDFVRMIAREYLNFTPGSLMEQVDGISSYLGQQPKEAAADSYKKHYATIQKDNVMYQFNIEEIHIVKKSSPFRVEVIGTRTIFAKENNKNFPAVYMFEIEKVTASKNNPYGLKVVQIVEKGQQGKGNKK